MLTDPVRVHIPLLIQPDNEPVNAWWVYDSADPYAVRIEFPDDDRENYWSFARELVRQGLQQPAGLGDVRLWPLDGRLWLTIESPDGKATFTTSRGEVRRFLAASYQAVPRGEEAVDVDAAIARLLGRTVTETIRVFYTGHAGGAVYGALTIAVLVAILLLARWSSRRQAARHRRGTQPPIPGGCRAAVYRRDQSTFDEQTWAEAAHVLGVPVHDYRRYE